MKAPNQKSTKPVPAGTHKARCYVVCDLGTHKITYKPGQKPKDVRQLLLTWELPECRMDFEDEKTKKMVSKPRYIGVTYTFSTYYKSNLATNIRSWMGKCDDNFDFESLLMEPCLINVIHEQGKTNNNVYAKVSSVSALMTGMTVPDLENDVIYYSITDHGKELPQSITDNERLGWLRDKIAESQEWKAMEHAAGAMGAMGVSQGQADTHDEAAPRDEPLPEDTTDYGNIDNTIHNDDIPF